MTGVHKENNQSKMARLRIQERAVLKGSLKKAIEELNSLINNDIVDNREYYQERRLAELNLLRPLDPNEIVISGERMAISEDI